MDKDCKEIVAADEIFVNAKVFLCSFHSIDAVRRRLLETSFSRDYRQEILNLFRECLYAEDEHTFDYCATALCNVGLEGEERTVDEEKISQYFTTYWFKSPELWAFKFRVGVFTLGNNTTNRLERFKTSSYRYSKAPYESFISFSFCRFHRTIKGWLQGKKTLFDQLIQVLLDGSLFRQADRRDKEKRALNRFPTKKLNPIISRFSQCFTRYAIDVIESQLSIPTTSFSLITVSFCFAFQLYRLVNTILCVIFSDQRVY
jgi:hypothetical protein